MANDNPMLVTDIAAILEAVRENSKQISTIYDVLISLTKRVDRLERGDTREFSETELAINVRNQMMDKLVRLQIDLEYFQFRVKAAKPETEEKKTLLKQIDLTKRQIKEGKHRLEMCYEYMTKLNGGKHVKATS